MSRDTSVVMDSDLIALQICRGLVASPLADSKESMLPLCQKKLEVRDALLIKK